MIKSNDENKMMIPIPKTPYYIRSDDLNFIITEEKVYGAKSVKCGETYLEDCKYYNTMEELFHGLLKLRVRQSQAASIKELKEDMKNIHDDITRLFKEVTNG